MASALTGFWAGDPLALVLAAALDLAIGDPRYAAHPVRLMGGALSAIERRLRRLGAEGYAGGILLFVILAAASLVVAAAVVRLASMLAPWLGWLAQVFLLYSLLALGDLIRHVWRVENAVARGNLATAHRAVSALVGRDTDRMDGPACRRAAVESLSESLTDGYTSALVWYAIAGLGGLVVFKVVSTMDSMVGFKTPRYREFGWCGARLDDLMNYLPARMSWLLIGLVAFASPGCSGTKALRIGLVQHAALPGPNSGWSEAATAGAIQRRIVGPIWMRGAIVTDTWIGDPTDPPLETRGDVVRALRVVTTAGVLAVALAATAVWFISRS